MNFDEIINELNERKSTHPNISTIWSHYLHIKKQKLDKAISDAKHMLKILEDTQQQDMTPLMIQLLLLLSETEIDNNII